MNIRNAIFLLASLLAASTSAADTLQFATEKGAIDGFDPVSYFSDARPERGDPGITANWNGVEWRFTSEQHRDAFVANPKKFAPQYGGFCALGMAHGGDVPTDPTAWTIWEGKLYLNMISEVSTTWRYNPDKLIIRADKKWQEMNAGLD